MTVVVPEPAASAQLRWAPLCPVDVPVEVDVVPEPVPLDGSGSSAMSPCALCAGHAFLLIRIFRQGFVAEPVLWQIHIFLLDAGVVVVLVEVVEGQDFLPLPFGLQVEPVDETTTPLSLPLPGGGPFATATEAATPVTNRAVINSALSFTSVSRVRLGVALVDAGVGPNLRSPERKPPNE